MADARIPLPGSKREPLTGARVLGVVDPDERFTVTVVLKAPRVLQQRPAGRFLSAAEYAATRSTPDATIEVVRRFARQNRLRVVAEKPVEHTVQLSGTAANMSAAFGVTLETVAVGDKIYRHRVGLIHVATDFADFVDVVLAVAGLDNRPQAQPRSRSLAGATEPRAGAAVLTPPQAAALYGFPTGVDGTGEIVAVIELGGGFAQADLNTYFAGLGLKVPSVTTAAGTNSPGTNTNADMEVMLDIEVIGGIAPGAKQLIYFAQNTDQDFLNAVNQAVNANPAPTALSISWGGAESTWTTGMMQSFTQAFYAAGEKGVSVFVASGDDGSSDGTSPAVLAVDFPASSPDAIGCGGTTVSTSGSGSSIAIASEVVWNDAATLATGGGVSQFFPKPSYQTVTVPPPPGGSGGGRGVPDVSGHAHAWSIRVDGSNTGAAGTSAVAPLWSGLAALIAQKLNRPLGLLTQQLYPSSIATSCFRDITQGDNDSTGTLGGKYGASVGWDPCTGLGSPKGAAVLAALTANTPTPPPPPPTPTTPTPHTPTPTPHTPTPTPHTPTPTPHTPTPTPHTPTPTPHTPTPTPHTPTPTPHTPTPTPGHTGGTHTTGHAAFAFPEMPPYPAPAAAPEPPAAPTPVAITSIFPQGSNTVALVGVVGLATLMGMVAATGVVAMVAINKDKP